MNESLWFMHPIRVRYQETDQMQVVYHANYLNWFEIGRTELIRQTGFPYQRIEALGLWLPVVEAEAKFHQPARYDDEIMIFTKIANYSNVRLEFRNEVRRVDGHSPKLELQSTIQPEGDLLVSGATRHVWVNRDWRPARIDKEAPELYEIMSKLCH
jgi:acyl-CoA thioester hydrolase